MAPTPLTLGGKSWVAAKPWSELPQPLLDRTCFFHHGTYTLVHADEQKVLRLNGNAGSNEMLVSLLGSQLARSLGTVQPQPIVLGPRQASEQLEYEGKPQPVIHPSAIAEFLGAPSGPLGQLTDLRDRDLDRLNAWVKREGNRAQARFIDECALSQAELRSISEELLSVLQGIQDDSVASQILAAVTLVRMKVAPVISLHIPFGSDNHSDPGLGRETEETVAGVGSIGALWSLLQETQLQDQVTFFAFNVFGRPLSPANHNGRDHNPNHNVAIMFGPGFRGSVVGGVEPFDLDYGATSIDSATGGAVNRDRGDIRFLDTLQAMAMTFTAGIGVDSGVLGKTQGTAKVIRPALAAG
jgi:hypothetical protein